MARFIAAGKKYPTPYVALPVWTRQGREAGALLTEIRLEDEGQSVVLSGETRIRGGEDGQFAGLQASRNGQTLMADSQEAALQLARDNPDSGVIIRLSGEEKLLNAVRLTGGRINDPAETAQAVRAVAEARPDTLSDDPIGPIADEQQKRDAALDKAARELAEAARRDALPELPVEEGDKRERARPGDDERQLRDMVGRDEREQQSAISEYLATERETQKTAREQMQRTEREWVVNVPEKVIEREKTLGGD